MRFVVLNPSIQKYKLRVLRDKPNENSIDKALVFDDRLFDTVKNIEWLMIWDTLLCSVILYSTRIHSAKTELFMFG